MSPWIESWKWISMKQTKNRNIFYLFLKIPYWKIQSNYPKIIFLHITKIAHWWRVILRRDIVGVSAPRWSMISLNPSDFVVPFVTMFETDSADVTKAFGWPLVNLWRQATCSNGWLTTDSISGMKNKKLGVEMSWLSSWLKSSWKSPALYYSTSGQKCLGWVPW